MYINIHIMFAICMLMYKYVHVIYEMYINVYVCGSLSMRNVHKHIHVRMFSMENVLKCKHVSMFICLCSMVPDL